MPDHHIHLSAYNEEKLTILVVEEDKALGEFLRMALTTFGNYQVFRASSSSEALAFTKEALPDLFLININISNAEEFQLYKHLHAQTEWQDVPIILLNVDQPFVQEEDPSLFSLQEPFDLDELLVCVNACLL